MQIVFSHKYRGSITVFISMTLLMVASLIFSLVEVAHYKVLKERTEQVSLIGMESGFAEYNRALYEDFDILAIDGGYCQESMNLGKLEKMIEEYAAYNSASGEKSYLIESVKNVEILEYGLLTDNGGAAFIKEAAQAIAYSIPDSLLGDLRETATKVDGGEIDENKISSILNDSTAKISEASASEEAEDSESIESPLTEEDQALLDANGSPIEAALEWKSRGVLAQVIGDMSQLSESELDSDDIPSKRKGVDWYANSNKVSVNVTERALYAQYLKKKFASYTNDLGHEGLKYEWEYVINGKKTDLGNLEATVTKLIAIREAENILALSKDSIRQQEALSIATAICAGLALPALITPVQLGILAAWAYLESILDVRLLLSGGKVSPLKSNEEWTSNILMFPNYISTSVMAKESSVGLGYEDYLGIMTILCNTNSLGRRSLDVVENDLRQQEYYENIRIENFIYDTKVAFEYEANPIFASVTPMLAGKLSKYNFKLAKEMSYL